MSVVDEDDGYVEEQLQEVDREVLRAILETDSPLRRRARLALQALDEQEGQS